MAEHEPASGKATGAGAAAGPAAGYSPRRWAALALTLLAVLMDMIDSTVLNVALPSVQRDLDASSSQLEWSVAGYTLAFAAAMITGARLGDRYGRRRIYLAGLAGFTLASVLAGVAANPEVLISARVLQGAAAAMMVPQVLAMLQVEFPKHEQPKAMSMYGMTFALGGLGGPLLGGVLLDADLFGLGWRPVFFVNVPIGIAGFLGALILTRESRAEGTEQAQSADLPGTALATAGLLALLYPLVEGRALGWPWWSLALMAACPAALWLFHRYERWVARRGGSPLIDPALLAHRGAVGGLLVAVLFFAGTAYALVLTVHLQAGAGYSPLRTAVSMIPFTAGVGIGSGIAPRLMPIGRKVVIAGCLVMAVGMALVLTAVRRYGADLDPWQLIPGMVVAGFGMAMVAGTLMTIVLAKVPARHSGAASSLINTSIQVGVAVGVALVGTVYFGQLDAGSSAVDAATAGISLVIGLYLAAATLALVLPAGRVGATRDQSYPTTTVPAEHDTWARN